MKIKTLLVLFIASLSLVAFGKDQGSGSDTSNAGGIPQPKFDACRWKTQLLSTYNGTPTNRYVVVSTASSVLGKVLVVPGGLGDTVTFYNAATAAAATNGNEILIIKIPITCTNTIPVPPLLIPLEFNTGSGLAAPNGIVATHLMGSTNDGFQVIFNYDTAISGRK